MLQPGGDVQETPGHPAHHSLLASSTSAAKEAVKHFQQQEETLSRAAECVLNVSRHVQNLVKYFTANNTVESGIY